MGHVARLKPACPPCLRDVGSWPEDPAATEQAQPGPIDPPFVLVGSGLRGPGGWTGVLARPGRVLLAARKPQNT
jgi:hypothetical protein